MKSINLVLMAGSLAVSSAFATDNMKKDDTMSKDAMPHMTMQQCKDHMAIKQPHRIDLDRSNREGMTKDDAMMKKDTMCADMMKKSEPMKK
ncbi:MAG: hypothetical protein M3Y55_04265 [Pseudomonadota bacterium]|nr:hypothetical protein [Pseudomonadota bacterium]